MFNPELKPAYISEIAVRWSDMDELGHVNNAAYLSYMEETRTQMLNQLGFSLDDPHQGPVVVTVSCTYLRQVVYPDRLRSECLLDQPGRSSFMTHYRVFSQQQPDEAECEGSAKVVWVDRASGRSTPLPEQIRALIERQTDTGIIIPTDKDSGSVR
jgi:acyl-CoA thioester hydrolase